MRALITGITGQDGSYLAEYLLSLGYEVFGIVRRSSAPNMWRIEHILKDIVLYQADLLDQASLRHVIREVGPHEIYNLAGQSSVVDSLYQSELTFDVNALGLLRLLEVLSMYRSHAKLYQASSSEVFGQCGIMPQNEDTPFDPVTPYAISKAAAHHCVNYWRKRGMFACSGIAFNHESERRGEEFVTRKITRAIARIKAGKQGYLQLGDLSRVRDWGFAGDYVKAMHLMLQQEKPQDYVLATGTPHSVWEFVSLAFGLAGLDPDVYIDSTPVLYRPTDFDLLGDPRRAKANLGWEATTKFTDLVEMMTLADLKREGLQL